MFASARTKNNSAKIASARGIIQPKIGQTKVQLNVSKKIQPSRNLSKRVDKSPRKNMIAKEIKGENGSVFQQISCTSAAPEVVESISQKSIGARKMDPIAKKPAAIKLNNSLQGQKPNKPTATNSTLVSKTNRPIKSAKPQAVTDITKQSKTLTQHEVTPRVPTSILRPCKCPACTRKRASGATDNTPAEGHVPQLSTNWGKPPNPKPSVKINEIRRINKVQKLHSSLPHKSPRSQLQTRVIVCQIDGCTAVNCKQHTKEVLNVNEDNFEDENPWQVVDKDNKSNGAGSFLRKLFNKSAQKARNDIKPNETASKVTDKLLDNIKEEFTRSDVEATLDSVSITLPQANNPPVYKLDREGSLATQCESFHFVEMPATFNKPDDNDVPFFALKDNTSNKMDVIRSKLGSRNGQRPQTVIEWKKGDMLGRGAFGTVWCGLTITGELIAVKQAEISSIDMEKANKEYEKVQQEVELLKSLHHNNIVGYLGTCLEGRVVSIFMQYIPGGSLSSIFKKFGSLAEPIVSRYTKQILDGVSYLHSKNVIHRDLKGSNIMLVPNGVIKLIDFGCAKKLMNITKSNAEILKSMKGTPYWMAPEVVNETGHGKKSDVWSIGCTVFEMATAKPPWAELNRYAALFAISSGTSAVPQLPEKFSQEAKNFVALCLKRDPKDRPDVEKLLENKFILQYWQPETRIQDSRCIPVNSNKKL